MLDVDETTPMSHADHVTRPVSGKRTSLPNGLGEIFTNELDLATAAIALGAAKVQPWSPMESALLRDYSRIAPPTKKKLSILRDLIQEGIRPSRGYFLRTTVTGQAA